MKQDSSIRKAAGRLQLYDYAARPDGWRSVLFMFSIGVGIGIGLDPCRVLCPILMNKHRLAHPFS